MPVEPDVHEGRPPVATGPFGTTPDERLWGMLCHLSVFAGYLAGVAQIVGPLVIWLVKKDQSAFLDDQGREAVNFRISVYLYAIVGGVLVFCAGIGIVLLAALAVFDVVVTIIAAIRAHEGVAYRYPLSIRLIK